MKRLLVFIVFLCGCSGESFSSGLFLGSETPDAGEHTDSAPFLGGGGAGTGGALGSGGKHVGTGGRGAGGASELEAALPDAYAAGGQPGTGGTDADAGLPPGTGGTSSGGSPGTGGVPPTCVTGEKVCNGVCVSFGPSNGCSLPTCATCAIPTPLNGVLSCNVQGRCDFNCLAGYMKEGDICCVPVTHDNGIGQTWQDCAPIGTWNQEQAMKACKASGSVHCLEGFGCGAGNLFIAGYNQDSTQHIGSWGYGGGLEGTACSIDNCGPSCPGPLTWK